MGIDFSLDAGTVMLNGVSIAKSVCTAAAHAPFTTNTYEIIRTSSDTAANFVVVFSPGQADCASYTACVDPTSMSADAAQVYESTPLMPMWPDISNSIALHDTTMRVVLEFTGITVGSSASSTRGLPIKSLISGGIKLIPIIVLIFIASLHATSVGGGSHHESILDQGSCAGTVSSCPTLLGHSSQGGGMCWRDEDGDEDQGNDAAHVVAFGCPH